MERLTVERETIMLKAMVEPIGMRHNTDDEKSVKITALTGTSQPAGT
jgi:hypothetical protein